MMRIGVLGLLALGLSVAALAQTAPPAAPAASAAAVTPATPYSATVPVAGTSDAQRSAAIAAALTAVLQGVAPGLSPGADMLASASGYVRDYRYRRAASGAGLELQVDFDPAAVGRLIAQSGGSSGATTPAPAASTADSAGAVANAAAPDQTAASGGTGTLWVAGIDSSHAFASLLAFLRGDSQLRNVVPVGADDTGVLLQVDFSQPLATVLAALETPDGHLAASPQPHPGADAALQWTP